jgi:hypothetical protein
VSLFSFYQYHSREKEKDLKVLDMFRVGIAEAVNV